MTITVNIVNQNLKLATNVGTIITGTKNFVKFKFVLDSSWDDLTKYAQFAQDGNTYDEDFDSDNSVYLPEDIASGDFTMVVCGTDSSRIVVTDYITLSAEESIFIS